MFEYDICRCGNAGLCPHIEECERARQLPPGIYTISDFYKENEECEYFMKRRDDNEKEI